MTGAIRLLSAGLLAGAVSILSCEPTRAAVLTETFTLPSPLSTSGNYDVPFALFNPAFGTLNSFSVVISGTATTPDVPGNLIARIDGGVPTPSSGNIFQVLFGGPFSLSYTDAADVSFVIGSGTGTIGIGLFENSGQTVTLDPNNTLTFNYTPAATAMPEPATLALLVTGVGGLAAARRRWRSI